MGFFKPADEADESDDAPIAGDEDASTGGQETGAVGLASDEGGDALSDAGYDVGFDEGAAAGA